ncbi:MAG TPA: hypothetical protein VEU33_35515 [Archangium sp.]|nr:hypothetical protein [Archangium sp.]
MHPSVAFSVDDTEDWGLPLAGPGLLLDVPREGPWRHSPSLHVEAAPDYRLRLSSGGQPLLWVRIDFWWDRCGFLRGNAHAPWGLPSLLAAEVREVTHAPGTDKRYEGIMRAAEHHLRAGAAPSLVDRVNRMLRVNYAQRRRSTVTRGWPLKGGLQAWRAEVLASRRWSPFPADAEDWEWFASVP